MMSEYIFNHVFLPVKLPQKDDDDERKNIELCHIVLDSLRAFETMSECKDWGVIVKMIDRLLEFKKKNTQGSGIEVICSHLQDAKDKDVIVIPVREQNACVLIRSCQDKTIFEAFEVDPPNEVVMGAVGRIVRSFPDTSITVPSLAISNEFEKELASFLVKMDRDTLEGSAHHTKKAGQDHIELRDTADPHYITGLLMSILSGLVDSSPTEIKGIVKHTRNDILWDQAYKPWRRSPLWLAIRVAIQLTLHQLGYPIVVYKSFMAFFMADVLSSKHLDRLPADTVFCAQSKLGHRMRKLADTKSASAQLMEKVIGVMESVSKQLHDRWNKVQEGRRAVQWESPELDIEADTQICLSNSRAYLDERIKKSASPSPSSNFEPLTCPRLFSSNDPYSELTRNNIMQAMQRDRSTSLVEMEAFVLGHLADLDIQQQPLDVVVLSECIDLYIAFAQQEYKGNPETSSIMILTVFVLWMILDGLTVMKLPLLKEYSLEISESLLNPVLLSTSLQIQRYTMVQRYLSNRHRNAKSSLPSIFDNQAIDNSFAIRYFKDSKQLQGLKAQIEVAAAEEREAKHKELTTASKERSSLLEQYDALSCTFDFHGRHRHYCNCPKCDLFDKAQQLSINVHEWPLPAHELYAKWTVFECNAPAEFRVWRATTYNILFGLCRPGSRSANDSSPAQRLLSQYTGLSKYVEGISVVTIASNTKSFANSHYRSLRVSGATKDNVSVNNGLNFRLYDTHRSRWIDVSSFDDCDLGETCTWKISPGTYEKLSYAISNTTHSPNMFIADQSEAPPTLNLHEHMSFGNLRCGSNLQWLNILRELRTRVLSFSSQEVQSLVLQAALQAGPVTDIKVQTQDCEATLHWHSMLTQQSFSEILLNEIDKFIKDIKENWAQDITLETLILLTLRLLASPPPGLLPRIYETLSLARETSYGWLTKLSGLAGSPLTGTASHVQSRICISAALCQLTYNVEAPHLDEVFKSNQDVANFIRCSIHLHDNTPSSNLPCQLIHLLARNLRLHDALHSNKDIQLFNQEALHQVLRAVWNPQTSSSNWELLDTWVILVAEQVRLNLKDGTFLVRGKPLGRLPVSITRHATYKRLLGNEVLDVFPSSVPGSDFETRDIGRKLHFRLEDTTLVIKSISDSQCFELIPHEILAPDFPTFLVQNFSHWLFKMQDGMHRVEFRPLQESWKPSDKNWYLVLNGKVSKMFQDGADSTQAVTQLVDMNSMTCKRISSMLQPLDTIEFLHVTWSSVGLVATLPRYKLSFTLRDSEWHSDNFPRMIIDCTQDCKTLYGLQNILALRSVTSIATRQFPSVKRSIIIPFHQVAVMQKADHVFAEVQKPKEASYIRYFKYEIDSNRCSLVGTTLLSELYRIYLHAITSHFLPDPLLEHTGTEEAVGFLCSSRCKSFQNLDDEEEKLLLQIASLAPKREWYPKSHQVMQSVEWFDIPPYSQHWSFPVLVNEILEYAESLSLFSDSYKKDKRGDSVLHLGHLAKRSLSNNLHLLSPWEHKQNLKEFEDCPYPLSDTLSPQRPSQANKLHLMSRIENASFMSLLVRQWPKHIKTNCNPWELLRAASQPLQKRYPGFSLTYDRHFLDAEFSKFWLPYYDACISALDKKVCKAQLMFTLSAIAYQLNEKEVTSSLLAFATYPEFRSIHPPPWPTYKLSDGCSPTYSQLEVLIRQHVRRLESGGCPRCPDRGWNESENDFYVRRRNAHEKSCNKDVNYLASFLVQQWNTLPSCNLVLPGNPDDYGHVHISPTATAQLKDKMTSWFSNFELETKFLQQIHTILCNCQNPADLPTATRFSVRKSPKAACSPARRCSGIPLIDLLCVRVLGIHCPSISSTPQPVQVTTATERPTTKLVTFTKLTELLDDFVQHEDILRIKYGWLLKKSCESRSQTHSTLLPTTSACNFAGFFCDCDRHFQSLLEDIRNSLRPRPGDAVERIQAASFHWPKINIRSLLALWHEISNLPPQSTEAMLSEVYIRALAQSLIYLQRSQRLGNFWLLNHDDEVAKELANEPNLDSQPIDWLFIQIEGNFLARPIQVEVAKKMITPYDGNTVIQLNMGEGKTSVIVPLVASTLADGGKLARVIVLKPLAKAMFSLLVQRLSGIVNRRVFYLPFSRAVDVTPERLQRLQNLFEICVKERGILVAQPEHILSFKLIGIDLINKLPAHVESESIVPNLLQSQRWLAEHCRDILDESDEILSVKYQLIYTSGRQAPIENHPHRWLQIQAIISLVLTYVQKSDHELDGIEYENVRATEFPIIRVLDAKNGNILSDDMATALLQDVKFDFLSQDLRKIAKLVVSDRFVEMDKVELLRRALTPFLWSTLLLYRGFCALGILQHLFREKRWRVNYGLYPERTLLAVPYRAKDVPALRADFGHPDVVVSLTFLSYYYGGLSENQFNETVRLLLRLDNPSQEYSLWTAGLGEGQFPRTAEGINLADPVLCDQLYKDFKRNYATINFYLTTIVFPKEAKQFPKKLATSSWDLAEERRHPTTGFSGTNDNRDLLPLSIVQRDPARQLGTNAHVLHLLLQPENNHYMQLDFLADRQILLSENYLTALTAQSPEICVLLDVGAQMLDKTNHEIASRWLDLRPNAEAAVFFDNDDRPVIMTRDKRIEAFEASPYSQKLECCLVYLDDAHTRGTDLKLPKNYRAAVTLGAGLTKDRLVQGCMRMRKLGAGQSVMFFAPHEVDTTIRKLAKKQSEHSVDTIDILRWVMAETCNSIHHNISHWAQQGFNYNKRNDAWKRFWEECDGPLTATYPPAPALLELRRNWEENDARSLEAMYGPTSETEDKHPAFGIPDLHLHLAGLGVHSLTNGGMDEEQERELSHEAEQERDVERPPPAQPAKDWVDVDIRHLVQHGIRKSSPAFVPMFSSFSYLDGFSSISSAWSDNLWSTKAFATTIIINTLEDAAEYQRPVHWLLTSMKDPSIVALSPYEVNQLLPDIQKSECVHLHMYAPRVNQTMDSFEDLTFFAIPPLPSDSSDWVPPSKFDIMQINLWAGQLYLKDQESYETLRNMLGIVVNGKQSGMQCEPDGFVRPQNRTGIMEEVCTFETSPLQFLRDLVGLRQKSKSYSSTHIGKILDGRPLMDKDFLSNVSH